MSWQHRPTSEAIDPFEPLSDDELDELEDFLLLAWNASQSRSMPLDVLDG